MRGGVAGFQLGSAAGVTRVGSFLKMPISHLEVIKKKSMQDDRNRAERNRELSMKQVEKRQRRLRRLRCLDQISH